MGFFKFMDDLSDAIEHAGRIQKKRDALWNAGSERDKREWDDLARQERQNQMEFFQRIRPAGSDKAAHKAVYDQRKRELAARRQHLAEVLGR